MKATGPRDPNLAKAWVPTAPEGTCLAERYIQLYDQLQSALGPVCTLRDPNEVNSHSARLEAEQNRRRDPVGLADPVAPYASADAFMARDGAGQWANTVGKPYERAMREAKAEAALPADARHALRAMRSEQVQFRTLSVANDIVSPPRAPAVPFDGEAHPDLVAVASPTRFRARPSHAVDLAVVSPLVRMMDGPARRDDDKKMQAVDPHGTQDPGAIPQPVFRSTKDSVKHAVALADRTLTAFASTARVKSKSVRETDAQDACDLAILRTIGGIMGDDDDPVGMGVPAFPRPDSPNREFERPKSPITAAIDRKFGSNLDAILDARDKFNDAVREMPKFRDRDYAFPFDGIESDDDEAQSNLFGSDGSRRLSSITAAEAIAHSDEVVTAKKAWKVLQQLVGPRTAGTLAAQATRRMQKKVTRQNVEKQASENAERDRLQRLREEERLRLMTAIEMGAGSSSSANAYLANVRREAASRARHEEQQLKRVADLDAAEQQVLENIWRVHVASNQALITPTPASSLTPAAQPLNVGDLHHKTDSFEVLQESSTPPPAATTPNTPANKFAGKEQGRARQAAPIVEPKKRVMLERSPVDGVDGLYVIQEQPDPLSPEVEVYLAHRCMSTATMHVRMNFKMCVNTEVAPVPGSLRVDEGLFAVAVLAGEKKKVAVLSRDNPAFTWRRLIHTVSIPLFEYERIRRNLMGGGKPVFQDMEESLANIVPSAAAQSMEGVPQSPTQSALERTASSALQRNLSRADTRTRSHSRASGSHTPDSTTPQATLSTTDSFLGDGFLQQREAGRLASVEKVLAKRARMRELDATLAADRAEWGKAKNAASLQLRERESSEPQSGEVAQPDASATTHIRKSRRQSEKDQARLLERISQMGTPQSKATSSAKSSELPTPEPMPALAATTITPDIDINPRRTQRNSVTKVPTGAATKTSAVVQSSTLEEVPVQANSDRAAMANEPAVTSSVAAVSRAKRIFKKTAGTVAKPVVSSARQSLPANASAPAVGTKESERRRSTSKPKANVMPPAGSRTKTKIVKGDHGPSSISELPQQQAPPLMAVTDPDGVTCGEYTYEFSRRSQHSDPPTDDETLDFDNPFAPAGHPSYNPATFPTASPFSALPSAADTNQRPTSPGDSERRTSVAARRVSVVDVSMFQGRTVLRPAPPAASILGDTPPQSCLTAAASPVETDLRNVGGPVPSNKIGLDDDDDGAEWGSKPTAPAKRVVMKLRVNPSSAKDGAPSALNPGEAIRRMSTAVRRRQSQVPAAAGSTLPSTQAAALRKKSTVERALSSETPLSTRSGNSPLSTSDKRSVSPSNPAERRESMGAASSAGGTSPENAPLGPCLMAGIDVQRPKPQKPTIGTPSSRKIAFAADSTQALPQPVVTEPSQQGEAQNERPWSAGSSVTEVVEAATKVSPPTTTPQRTPGASASATPTALFANNERKPNAAAAVFHSRTNPASASVDCFSESIPECEGQTGAAENVGQPSVSHSDNPNGNVTDPPSLKSGPEAVPVNASSTRARRRKASLQAAALPPVAETTASRNASRHSAAFSKFLSQRKSTGVVEAVKAQRRGRDAQAIARMVDRLQQRLRAPEGSPDRLPLSNGSANGTSAPGAGPGDAATGSLAQFADSDFRQDPEDFVANVQEVFDDVMAELNKTRDCAESRMLLETHTQLTEELQKALAELRSAPRETTHDAEMIRQHLVLQAWVVQSNRELNLSKIVNLIERKLGRHGFCQSYLDEVVYVIDQDRERAAVNARTVGRFTMDRTRLARMLAQSNSLRVANAPTTDDALPVIGAPVTPRPPTQNRPAALTARQRYLKLHRGGLQLPTV
jgi:hypothetical protein